MSKPDFLVAIGVNTGNSLDAADVVLTKFALDGSIADLHALSVPMPDHLAGSLRLLRSSVVEADGIMDAAARLYRRRALDAHIAASCLDELVRDYTLYVSAAVNELIKRASEKIASRSCIDVIGFHGQTCAHKSPSIAGDGASAYTLQIGDGQLLADETGVPVVFDFRSDDMMAGGEAAPLAPVHHAHLARILRERGKFPVAFCNAGNTGNISVITERPGKGLVVTGWDVGPFNDYADKLMQGERAQACDFDGQTGAQGQVNVELLRLLFDKGAVTDHGESFLLLPPPKSSDPQWYRLLPELLGKACLPSGALPFQDRLRTAEYFASYVYFYSLKWIADEVLIPTCFALCGGGWMNPVCRDHFEKLLHGRFDEHPVLPEHKSLFASIRQRLCNAGRPLEVAASDEFGFSGKYMEARIFADAAVCRIKGEPFTSPATTGCLSPAVLGILRFPHKKPDLASVSLKTWLSRYKSMDLTLDKPGVFDGRWSRAARGWSQR